jgi:predicted O-methyltransferase YrrM
MIVITPTLDLTYSQILDDLYGGVMKTTLDGREREITPIQSIPRSAAEFLYKVVRAVRPQTAIEVGMAWGFSSVAICSALRDGASSEKGAGVNVVIDPYQVNTYEGVALATLEKFGLSAYVRHQEQRSDLFLPKFWEGKKNTIQFAFIDGDHRIDAVFMDFYYVNKLLDEQGVVIFDDYQFSSVTAVVGYALKNFHYEQLPCPESRFAVLRKVKHDDRSWEAYGQF